MLISVKSLKNIHVIALAEVHTNTNEVLNFFGQNGFRAIYSPRLVNGPIVAGPTRSHREECIAVKSNIDSQTINPSIIALIEKLFDQAIRFAAITTCVVSPIYIQKGFILFRYMLEQLASTFVQLLLDIISPR